MSLLRDFKTDFIEAASVVASVLEGKQFTTTSPITVYLSAQPINFNSLNGAFTTLNVEGSQGYPGQTIVFHTSKPFAVLNPGNSVITETGAGDGAGGMLMFVDNSWKLVANSGSGGTGGTVVVTGGGVPAR